MIEPKPLKKPLLRGYLHQEAFFIALGACILLVMKSSGKTALISSIAYSLGLLLMFGISAIYHRPHWEPKKRAFMRRLDHSAIFTLVAGSFTPLCLLALPEQVGPHLLTLVGIATLAGFLQSIFWVSAPRWLTVIFYVSVCLLIAPYLPELKNSLGMGNVFLILIGGAFHTVGAVFYAIKKPRLNPVIFGYHELFHLFTIIGAAFHFSVFYQLIH